MEFTLVILLITFAIAWLFIKFIKFFLDFGTHYRIFGKMPGPSQTPYPLVGHASFLNAEPDNTYGSMKKIVIENVLNRNSEIGCFWMGPIPVVTIAGPTAAEDIMRSSEHLDKTFFYKFLHTWLGLGLLTSTGKKWKSRRRLLTPGFHFSILQDFLPIMNKHAEMFANNLNKFDETEEYFDLFKPVGLCALDIICETAMGKNINAQVDEGSQYVRSITRISHLIMERLKYPWYWLNAVYNLTKDGMEYNKHVKNLHLFTKSVINDRMAKFEDKKTEGRLAFLDLLIKASEDGKSLSIDDIREEVDTFMFEGHDTTTAGISWTLYLIGSYPDVQKRIHEEVDSVFEDEENHKLTSEDLRKLEYLELVIKESHRYLSPVPLIGRNTTTDCKINGYDIPKNTCCIIFIQLINNLPGYWKNPEKFDPERFRTENSGGRHPYAYLPFSAGPRNCIGQKFALMEEKVVLAHTLRKYRIESRDKKEDIPMLGDLIMRPKNGVHVKLKKRSGVVI